ncbi:MAG: alpha/beta hydrolase [Chloroflexota bacterium]
MPTDARVDVGDIALHYLEWGDRSANRAIVLVHGLGSTAHIWDLCAAEIAERTEARVIAVDQRGHGESDQPTVGYDFASVVGDLDRFLDAVGVTTQTVCVGHSWGASVVLQLAAAHPERVAGLVLVDGGISSPGERWTWDETSVRLRPPDLDGMRWDDLRGRMTRNNPAYHDPRSEVMGRSMFRIDDEGKVERRFHIPNHMQVVRALWEQRPADLLARLACPVLILPARRPTDDPSFAANKLAGVERAVKVNTNARARWFEDTVHDIPLHRPVELADELVSFSAEVLYTRAAS